MLVAYYLYRRKRKGKFELNSSEQYYYLQSIARHSDTADIIIDPEQIVRFANDRFLELFNLKGESIDSKKIVDISLPEEMVKHIENSDPGNVHHSLYIEDDHYDVRIVAVTNNSGEFLGKLVKIKHEQHSISVKDHHVSQWMHDLNTPLNAIAGYSELLVSENNLTKIQKEYLDTIHEHSHLLKERIENLLTDREINKIYQNGNDVKKRIHHILIADDVPINRTLLRIILKRNGYKITEAENGKEALEFASGTPDLDLILMDLSMPVMDGIEAVKHIRLLNSMQSGIPIIAVTASSLYKNKSSLKERGFNGLIKKPFKEMELLNMLKEFELN
jgi:CheY-like chemotaxis protein